MSTQRTRRKRNGLITNDKKQLCPEKLLCSNCRKSLEPPSKKKKREAKYKLFNDPIHGSMMFHPVIVAIIDTPEFQRLRDIKQLGAVYYVYPGASHNRFEHSLGVCHIAGQLLEQLVKVQPDLNITDEEILMVQIAGLCHDMGHGPFSHIFERHFIPAVLDGDHLKKSPIDIRHGGLSLYMFDHMLENHPNVRNILQDYNITEKEIQIIKAFIYRQGGGGHSGQKELLPSDRHFLFEIVSNKTNGVDVDKWDYFKRDMYHLGMQAPFDYIRMMKFYKVIEVNGKTQICSRDKEAISVYEMFTTRQIIHRRATQHKVVMSVNAMILNGFLAADKFITILGKDRKPRTMSECVQDLDMVAFTKLTDSVFYQILASDDPNLESAQAWLRAVQNRKVYRIVAETGPITDTDLVNKTDEEIAEELKQYIKESDLEDLEEIAPFKFEHKKCPKYKFVVQTMRLNFGRKGTNPVDRFRFYRKTGEERPVIVKAAQISSFLPPNKSEETSIRFLLRPTSDQTKDKRCHTVLLEAYKQWFCRAFPEYQPQTFEWTYGGYENNRDQINTHNITRREKKLVKKV